MSEVQIGAYFYPLTQQCTVRRHRAGAIGRELGSPEQEVPDELVLAQHARPLFEGHDQPKTYCLEIGDDIRTTWDDIEHDALCTQVSMALNHGLSYFIFDSYNGMRNGVPEPELYESNRIADRGMQWLGMLGFKFARMEALEGTRSILPVPMLADLQRGFNGGFAEPDRAYDVTPQAARYIVDANINAWRNPAYLRVGGWRPYLSIMMPTFTAMDGAPEAVKQSVLNAFIDELRTYAMDAYGEAPYVVGVVRQASDLERWAGAEADMITQYCALPEYGSNTPPIQQYDELVLRREAEWYRQYAKPERRATPFVPSVAIGWDASPRGEQGYDLETVAGLHPYTPVVVGNTPERFEGLLRKAIDFIVTHVQPVDRYMTIFAWNEVGEGATLLKRLMLDGTVDRSFLEAVSRVSHDYGACALCRTMPDHSGRPQPAS